MKLFNHQQQGIDFILNNHGSGAIFHSIGLGKTRTALEIFSRLPVSHMLVICPLSLIEAAWGEDIKKFTNFTYTNLRNKKWNISDIYIGNYEMLLTSKFQRVIDFVKPNDFMCVFDESSRFKSHNAKTTKVILKLRELFKHRIIMSATPAPNSEMEFWPQMRFLGDIFHHSFYAFRNTYFHLQRGSQMMRGQVMSRAVAKETFSKGWKYDITEKNKQSLISVMKPHCHYAKKEDCLDLPEQIDEIRKVEMTSQQRKIYLEMKRECIVAIKNDVAVAQVALTRIMKLRQITAGFIISTEGNIMKVDSPKIRELSAVLEEAGKQQVIIWCQFHWEIETIARLLGDRCVTLYGRTKDKDASIAAF